MIKASFSREKFKGFAFGIAFGMYDVPVPHPYNRGTVSQWSLHLLVRLFCYDLNFVVYKPAKILLTRKERRANKMK